MIGLRAVDVLGIYVAPAFICLLAALFVGYGVRRVLDAAGVDRWIWNRALFDFSVLLAVTALLILALERVGA